MLKEKADWALSQLGTLSRELFAVLMAIIINELRKLFWTLILNSIGQKPIGVNTMQKAYDLKVLIEKFKARGLDLAEDMAKMVVEETCDWVVESAAVSENKIDDVAALGMPHLKKLALELTDKIDGKEG